MKTEDGKTTKIGNGQSTGTTGETGPSPLSNSKEKDSGEKIVGIEKIGDLLGGKSISTTLDYVKFFGLPAKKNGQAVWELDLEKFKSWAAEIGWTRQMPESEIRVQVRKRDLEKAGPGKVIEAKSLDALAQKLFSDIGRIQSYMRQSDCPIQKKDGGTCQVDLNRWELFQIQYRIGEYRLTGNQKGRISWS